MNVNLSWGDLPVGVEVTITLLLIWSLVWKGFALYRAGANRSKGWFIVLFILNTAGILDILYLIFSRKKQA